MLEPEPLQISPVPPAEGIGVITQTHSFFIPHSGTRVRVPPVLGLDLRDPSLGPME